jgi:hypothetical protein
VADEEVVLRSHTGRLEVHIRAASRFEEEAALRSIRACPGRATTRRLRGESFAIVPARQHCCSALLEPLDGDKSVRDPAHDGQRHDDADRKDAVE